MTTLTLELPDTLVRQLHQKQVSDKEIQAIAQAALEIWLANAEARAELRPEGRFSESAVPFMRRLISRNRELFETLARQ